jgi:hypothetical protein
MKLGDEIVELKDWDAVRVPPGTWRGYEAGPEALEIPFIGAPNLGDAPSPDELATRRVRSHQAQLWHSGYCVLCMFYPHG